MAEVFAAQTSGSMLVCSDDVPGAHAACDAEIARLRARLAALEAAVRQKVAREIRDRASSLWPPGMQRDQLYAAADVVARGGEGQERSDEKEAGCG